MTVAGHLNADAVPELERAIGELEGPLRLDLANLRSADDAGVGALRRLRERGVALTGLSPFQRLLLGETSSPAARRTAPRKAREPTTGPDGPPRGTSRRGGR